MHISLNTGINGGCIGICMWSTHDYETQGQPVGGFIYSVDHP